MGDYKVLNKEELENELASISEWKVQDKYLKAKFKFSSFRDAISLINRVAIEAEMMNHHPKYSHNFDTVKFKLTTHDAEGNLTDLDLKMAKYISSIYSKYYKNDSNL